MSSTRLTDIESKINEVRDRLTNLSQSFQRNDNAVQLQEAIASRHAEQQQPERQSLVLAERSINAEPLVKGGASGGFDRLVELAKREAVQRRSGDATPRLNSHKESRCTSLATSERSHSGLQMHTYYDSTPAPPHAQPPGAAAAKAVPIHHIERPLRSATFYTASTSASAATMLNAPHAGRFSGIDTTPTPLSHATTDVVGRFDPFQVVQSRLREKLRKSAVYSSPPSSPEKTSKASSPVVHEAQQTYPSVADVCAPRTMESEPPSSTTQEMVRNTVRQKQEEERGQSTETRSPSIRAAADAIRCVRGRFASADTPGRQSSTQSFATGEKSRQRHAQEEQKRQLRQDNTGHLSRIDSRPRYSSASGKENVANCTPLPRTRQPSRRSTSAGSLRSSPSHVSQPALPRKTTPQRTVLDVLTGAEVFALMRLRGVLVSRGDTGECMLPETRCHSIYLSQDEHRQLLELRTKLRLHSASVKTSDKRCPEERRGHVAMRATDRAAHTRQPSPSPSGVPRR